MSYAELQTAARKAAFALSRMIATNPLLAIITGLFVASVGGGDLWETKKGVVDGLFSSQAGLALVGTQQAAFGVANLLMGFRLTGIGLLGAEHRDHHDIFNRMLRRYVENPYLSFTLGLMLLVMVTSQAWEEWVYGSIVEGRSVWYFGLILIGVLTMARSLEKVFLALGLIDDSEKRGGFAVHLAETINRHIRKPWLIIFVALLCIVLGVAEELFFTATDPGSGVFIAHYGFLIFTLLEAAKLIPILFPSAALASEGLTLEQTSDRI